MHEHAQSGSVVIVSHYLPPHIGGIEQVAAKQAMAFQERGYRVTMIATAAAGETSGTVTLADGVVVVRLAAWTIFERRLFIPFPVLKPGAVRTLLRTVWHADMVVIHDMFYMTSWFAALAARMRKKPYVLVQHVALVDHASAFVMALQHMVYAVAGLFIIRGACVAVAYNNRVAAFLRARSGTHVQVVELRNGIDLERFRPARDGAERSDLRRKYGLPTERTLALYVGRLVHKKGYDIVYDARDEAYDIVFAGSGEVPSAWTTAQGVHVLGPRSQDETAEILRACDMFVFAARGGEVLTLTMQEACASGLPLVVTRDEAYAPYALPATVVRFVDGSPESFKAALRTLARERKSVVSSDARRLAEERFDWRRNVAAFIDLCERVIVRDVVVTTSWDDGHVLDLRLAELLDRYGVKGTFYIAPENRELPFEERLTEQGTLLLARHHEVGAHTLTHRHLTTLSDAEARSEIQGSKERLERTLGTTVASFCYPAGKYRTAHPTMVREAGFMLARTVRRFALSVNGNPFEMPTTVHTYDHWLDAWPLLRAVHFNPLLFARLYMRWDRIAMHLFDRALAHGGVFHLWGHSWEVEARGDWKRLEHVLQYIGGRADVRYVTNGDVVRSRPFDARWPSDIHRKNVPLEHLSKFQSPRNAG